MKVLHQQKACRSCKILTEMIAWNSAVINLMKIPGCLYPPLNGEYLQCDSKVLLRAKLDSPTSKLGKYFIQQIHILYTSGTDFCTRLLTYWVLKYLLLTHVSKIRDSLKIFIHAAITLLKSHCPCRKALTNARVVLSINSSIPSFFLRFAAGKNEWLHWQYMYHLNPSDNLITTSSVEVVKWKPDSLLHMLIAQGERKSYSFHVI